VILRLSKLGKVLNAGLVLGNFDQDAWEHDSKLHAGVCTVEPYAADISLALHTHDSCIIAA
jgi:hypothetical protein